MLVGDHVEVTVRRSGRRLRVRGEVVELGRRRVRVRIFGDQLVWLNPARAAAYQRPSAARR